MHDLNTRPYSLGLLAFVLVFARGKIRIPILAQGSRVGRLPLGSTFHLNLIPAQLADTVVADRADMLVAEAMVVLQCWPVLGAYGNDDGLMAGAATAVQHPV